MDTYKISGNIIDKQVMDDLILLDLETGNYHSLNETAAFIWKKVRADRNVEYIIDDLQKEYEITAQDAATDTYVILEQMKGLGFLE